jgi:drug/metabolite transporter (DMT)-like permease
MPEMAGEGESDGPRRDAGAAVFLVLMVLIGSTTATAAKFAVQGAPLGLLPLARFGVAGLVLLPIVARGGALLRMLRRDPWLVVAAASFCVPINQTFFLAGTAWPRPRMSGSSTPPARSWCWCWPRRWGRSGWCPVGWSG